MKNNESFISVSVCFYCSSPWYRVISNRNLEIVGCHHPFAGMLHDASMLTISNFGKPPELSVQCRPSSFPSLLWHLKNHLALGSMRHVGLKQKRQGVALCSHSNDELQAFEPCRLWGCLFWSKQQNIFKRNEKRFLEHWFDAISIYRTRQPHHRCI